MSETNKKNQDSPMIDIVIGSTTTVNIERYGRATSEFVKGYNGTVDSNDNVIKKGLKQISESKVNPDYEYSNIKQQAGFSAEVTYVNKTNANNIINHTDIDETKIRIYRSNDIGRGNDQVYDILSVDEQGNPFWGAQMKFCGKFGSEQEIDDSAHNLVNKLAGDKWERYRGNKVLIPKEQYKEAKQYAEERSKELHREALKLKEQGSIEKAEMLEVKADNYQQISKDLMDSGITSKEAIFIREHPKLATAKYVFETANKAGIENAKSAAVISLAISTAQNTVSIIRGEKELDEAVIAIGKDIAIGSGTAYVIGATDSAVRGFMASSKNSVFVDLSKTNAPSMIATATIQIGKSLLRYANGEIDSLQLVEELGERGTGLMAASLGAAIGTAVFPGIGTVIGSMVGYMASSTLYQACMQTLHNESLSFKRREMIHKLATAAIEAINKQGKELLQLLNTYYSHRQQVFNQAIINLEEAAISNKLELFTSSLNNIVIEIGSTLQFKNFNEFNSFMLDKNTALEF